MKTTRWAKAMLVAWCALFCCAAASAQVLEQLPDKTLVVVKIKNLSAVSGKIAGLAQRMDVAGMWVGLPDLLNYACQQNGIKEGLDKSGDVMVVGVYDDTAPGPGGMKAMVLVPITDYQKFLGNFPSAAREQEMDTIEIKGTKTFVADWGKYAVCSDDAAAIKKGPGIKVGPAAAKEMDTKDVSILLNVGVVAPRALTILQQNGEAFMTGVMSAAPEMKGNETMLAMMRVIFKEALDGFQAALRDGQSVVFSINVNDDGIVMGLVGEFSPASHCGQLVQSFKNTDASFTALLPDQSFGIFGGETFGSGGAKLANQIMDSLVDALAKLNTDAQAGKAAEEYKQAVHEALATMQGGSAGVITAPGKLAGPVTSITITTGDGAKLRQMQKKTEDYPDMLQLAGGGLKGTATCKPDAKTIVGVSFDEVRFVIDPSVPPIVRAKMHLGPDGAISTTFGQVDDKHVIQGMNADDALLSAAIDAIRTAADPLAKRPEVQLVNRNLPANRLAAFYVTPDFIVNTITDAARTAGQKLPAIDLPPNVPPMGFTISQDGSAIRADWFIAGQTIKSAITAALQFQLATPPPGGGGL